jgi:chromate transporter
MPAPPDPDSLSHDSGKTSQARARAHPSFAEATRFWLKLGFISFGGPTGQIAIMHAELVEKRRWISEGRFLHALNYCMLLPGPEAQQLATYVGWLLHRTLGGIVAGSLFVLPSAFLLWALSWIYAAYGQLPDIAAVFAGLKPAVLAIVLMAIRRLGAKALVNRTRWLIALLAFVALFFFHVPFPLIIAAAAFVGWILDRFLSEKQTVPAANREAPETNSGSPTSIIDDATAAPSHARPSGARAVKVIAVAGALWWLPVLAIGAWLGTSHTLFQQGLFFSKAAMVTFGGAYAVLPYVSQQAVENYGWLSPSQMLDGLGLAETTPGPLIMVLQFVGFLGGWKNPAPLSPLAMATFGAAITTWTTFLPCFLWIFLGAPYIERLRNNARLAACLSAITAAVVGVMLNLAVWFGWHVLFPTAQPINWFGLGVCLLALFGLSRWRWDIIPVVGGAGLIGFLAHQLGWI